VVIEQGSLIEVGYKSAGKFEKESGSWTSKTVSTVAETQTGDGW